MPHQSITNLNKGLIVYSLIKEIPVISLTNGHVLVLDYSDEYLKYNIEPQVDLDTLVNSNKLLIPPNSMGLICRNYEEVFEKLAPYYSLLYNSLLANYGDVMRLGNLVIADKRIISEGGEVLSKRYNGRLILTTLIALTSQ